MQRTISSSPLRSGRALLFGAVAALVAWLSGGQPARAAEIDFRRQVQPILAEHCYRCHGADEKTRSGGLRLDVRSAALLGGESDGAAIVPGQPDQSALVQRVTAADADTRMPPAEAKKPLSAEQIQTLRSWIAQGADYARHWAFDPPVAVPVPAGQNAIDFLLEQKLAAAGLSPAPPAEPAVVARRLHLDLIGLPPSPTELDAFEQLAKNQGLAAACEQTAARLLESPRYGERWARVWLDVARYSDSNGFEKDLPRAQWAWRDWVIDAWQRDLPYDRFLVEQLAGDLLPDAGQAQRVATGFLRNGMINEEGAIVPEQFRIEGLFDRMDCLGKAVLGLSLQCAQCHSHKFDPISQTEYYGIFAFLNDTYEAQSWVYTPEEQRQIASIQKGLTEVDQKLQAEHPQWAEEIAAWEKQLLEQEPDWQVLSPTELLSKSGLNHPVRLDDNSVLTLGHPSTKSDLYLIYEPTLQAATGLRLEALPHGDLPFGGPGFSKLGTWAITELEVHTQLPESEEWIRQPLVKASADFAEPDHRIEEIWHSASTDKGRNRSVGPVAYLIDQNDQTGFRADRGPGRRNTAGVAVVQFAAPLTLPAGTRLRVTLRTNHGGDDNGRSNVMLGRCRVALTTSPDPQAAPVDYAAILALHVPPAERSDQQRRDLLTAWRDTTAALASYRQEAQKLWEKYPEAPTSVLHLAQRRPPLTRTTHLLDRGIWDRPQQSVPPQVPAAFNAWQPPSAGGALDRLALAQWLTDRQAPLTARVEVNRVWQTLFGRGLVETAEDFGTRTAEPEHRLLLDRLAVDLMDQGWSHKRLLGQIVASRFYRQSSQVTPELLRVDPENRLLARAPRFRVDAEVVRDIALEVSGLMHHQVGGPSVFPPVPDSVLEYNYFKPTYWQPPQDSQRYRRSLYLFRKRSMPDPVMSVFDAPNGDAACARRLRSNTPLAALTGLNEPVFVEAAQALALRVLREGGDSDRARADYAIRLCLARHALPEEQELIVNDLARSLARLQRGELNALQIAFNPLTQVDRLPADATPNQIAAWTLVSRVLLNMHETLTRQ